MKLIIPTAITDTILVSTNVHESIADVWSAIVTYAAGDFVYVADGTQRDIYEATAANLDKDPETETAWWNYISTTYAPYAVGTTYALADVVIDTTNHYIYESLQAANTGNALTATAWWLRVGSTEPWKAFDAKVGSQVERTGTIYYELTPGTVEGIAFFNLDAVSVTLLMTDPTDGVVFDETIELIGTENVVDGYTYCFAPIISSRAIVRTSFPPYDAATLEITITADTETTTAKVGEIVLGRALTFGATQYGASFEIIDYSRKTVDAWGNFSVTERPFSQRVPIDVIIDNAALGFLKHTLEDYRATPVVCVPTEATSLSGPFLTYGYYRTARVVVPYPSHSILTIEWEGLT